MLTHFQATQWNENFDAASRQQALSALESGGILYFPTLPFELSVDEKNFLSVNCLKPGEKNISFLAKQDRLSGVQLEDEEKIRQLKHMMRRFFDFSTGLMSNLFPGYANHLIAGRTSFRPAEIAGRKTSYRKDDSRLHVDSFPSSPNQGKRILRVFCNINPHQQARTWRVGEPFETVAEKFLPRCSKPVAGFASLLHLLKITKTWRSAYDHYMLQIHNKMKADEVYQSKANQQVIHFPPASSWIVQTDSVSHAAMSGQFVMEQTFYLPVHGMQDPSKSPLGILEKLLGKSLVLPCQKTAD